MALQLLEQRGRPRGQLAEQVFPFVAKLTPRDGERFYPADSPYLAARETVSARRRLVVNRGEIGIDGKTRRRVSAKSFELRMAGVAACPAAQHGLRQQRLAPQRDQPFRIEIPRVQRPETHRPSLRSRTHGCWTEKYWKVAADPEVPMPY